MAEYNSSYSGAQIDAAVALASTHASRHASGGADALKLDDLSAPDDTTDLDASTSKHGLLPKLGGGTANFLRADGSWAAPSTTPGDASVSQAKLDTSDGSVSSSAGAANITLPGGAYGFYPQVKSEDVSDAQNFYIGSGLLNASYTTNIYISQTGGKLGYAQQTYVTNSGEIHWVYVLRRKDTGAVLMRWQAPDHVCMGNGGNPQLVRFPFNVEWLSGRPHIRELRSAEVIPGYVVRVPTGNMIEVEILVFQLGHDEVGRVLLGTPRAGLPDMDFMDSFDRLFEADESKDPTWFDEPVTVGLPRFDVDGNPVSDWRLRPEGTAVVPIKKPIPKPEADGFYAARLKRR